MGKRSFVVGDTGKRNFVVGDTGKRNFGVGDTGKRFLDATLNWFSRITLLPFSMNGIWILPLVYQDSILDRNSMTYRNQLNLYLIFVCNFYFYFSPFLYAILSMLICVGFLSFGFNFAIYWFRRHMAFGCLLRNFGIFAGIFMYC